MISYDSLLKLGRLTSGILNIEKSFSISTAERPGAGCMLVVALSAFCGEKAPKICFSLTAPHESEPFYISHSYSMGKKNEYTRQSWRVPPMFLPGMLLTVSVTVPEGTVLNIKDFGTSADPGVRSFAGGLRHNAHLGFWGMAPDNTMPAFELAAASGFGSCIVVPKVTKDGVLVCIHDDTINKTARDSNGEPAKEKTFVWDKTYEELLEWEYGSYKNQIYKGTKIPLLSDFFDLCAKTGMCPMFSTHPGLTFEQWKEVRAMLECRQLLRKFHIKSFDIEILKTAYSVFGTDIDGYTYDRDKWGGNDAQEILDSGFDVKACRCGVEIPFKSYTKEIACEIRAAGLFAAAWNVPRCDFSEYERLISWGVSEFTEDYHCSIGLNY